MANFFINRPVFAWVIAIILMMAGAIAIPNMPVAQYPSIAPPAVSIWVIYPGASAETVQSTVAQVIEQQLSGIDNLIYFSSESDKDGSMIITLSFKQGTNPDIAQVQVQNKLDLAMPSLPQEVQALGVRVVKSNKNFLLVVALVSTDGSMSSADIGDFIASNLQDPLSRTLGVGDYLLFGSQYAMRIWLDPAKLDHYSLTPEDVSRAIEAQNVQISSGELGGLPSISKQQLNATVIGPSRMQTPEEFSKILLKVNPDSSQVRLRDVATVGLGPENYSITGKYNGKPAAAIGFKLATGANALKTAEAVKATIEKLKSIFPHGLEVEYPYDTTPLVKESVKEVVKTLFEAIGLVFLVMYLFLQNIRATLIPTLVVPVVLLGTFAILSLAGFGINILTMLAMVLAIGLLVDDAIVVVENVERVMAEEGLSPKEATKKAMSQVTGALIGIALVLAAVFVPMAFFGGSTGVIYRQFSITIASAMGLSVLVAIVFTPALCATMLKQVEKGHHEKKRGFFGLFNRLFDASNRKYTSGVGYIVRGGGRNLAIYLAMVVIAGFVFMRLPKGFLPEEDQGLLVAQVTTPPGTPQKYTQEVLDRINKYFRTKEGNLVESVFTVAGFSFAGRGQSSGMALLALKDWAERPGANNSAQAIANRAMAEFQQYRDSQTVAFTPPAVIELGNSTGFDFELIDEGNVGHGKLTEARNQLLGMAAQDPRLTAVRANGLDDETQYKIEIDREKANALSLSTADINATLSAAWGAEYVNEFLDRGRVKNVYIQGNEHSRMVPEHFEDWFVRNSAQQMVPFDAFSTGVWIQGSPKLERYNGRSSFEILGEPASRQSSGTAMKTMEELAGKLPHGIGFDWTGLSYEERAGGSQVAMLYAISLAVVFLCLAALYESWSIPVAVLLAVPLGVLGAALATTFRGLENDVFFQVGLITTIGLSAKNAILIVEFARANFERGMSLADAASHAASQRLRPILMTSFAFIMGVLPLAISTGAGSGSHNAIGTTVVGGMLSATVLACLFVPLFFVVTMRLFKVKPTGA
jgi:hydrophobe/amphiphile efflux-1 (HAE1) family protein